MEFFLVFPFDRHLHTVVRLAAEMPNLLFD